MPAIWGKTQKGAGRTGPKFETTDRALARESGVIREAAGGLKCGVIRDFFDADERFHISGDSNGKESKLQCGRRVPAWAIRPGGGNEMRGSSGKGVVRRGLPMGCATMAVRAAERRQWRRRTSINGRFPEAPRQLAECELVASKSP